MKTLCVVAVTIAATYAAALADVSEATSSGNVAALTGKWKPSKRCHHLLQPDLLETNEAGFEITIDEKLGDSHRKASGSDTYYQEYAKHLTNNGHKIVASGVIKFDYDSEAEHIISQKNGSLYLRYGIVAGGNPRIFVGRGGEEDSADTLAIEWTSWCSDDPTDAEEDYVTVTYERAVSPQVEKVAALTPAVESKIPTFQNVRQNKDYRVTILGLTKGIAFLSSQELVSGSHRPPGKHTVPWLRVATVIEKLTDKDEAYGFRAETSDGKELVGKIGTEVKGHSITSRASGAAQMDLDHPPLHQATFPAGLPEGLDPKTSHVFLFTMSGSFQRTETVVLRFSFGDEENRRELVFTDVPMP